MANTLVISLLCKIVIEVQHKEIIFKKYDQTYSFLSCDTIMTVCGKYYGQSSM